MKTVAQAIVGALRLLLGMQNGNKGNENVNVFEFHGICGDYMTWLIGMSFRLHSIKLLKKTPTHENNIPIPINWDNIL